MSAAETDPKQKSVTGTQEVRYNFVTAQDVLKSNARLTKTKFLPAARGMVLGWVGLL